MGKQTNILLNVYKLITDVKLLLLHSNTWNYLTVTKQMSPDMIKKILSTKFLDKSYILCKYRIWH